MFKYKLVRAPAPVWMRTLIPVAAILLSFIITSVFVVIAGANPFDAFYNFLIVPLSSQVSALEVLVKATPLILTGIAVTFAFTSGYFNIGAEGQLYAGVIVATWLGVNLPNLPAIAILPLMILGGFLGGLLWALIPALLKVYLKIDEVVTTLLMNSIIMYFVSYLLNDYWRNPQSGYPQSPDISQAAHFATLVPKSRLHVGFIMAILIVAITYFLIKRTPLGLKMRASGANAAGARFAGINVERTMLISALVSGGIAGLAGMSEIAGIQFHLISALSSNFGYTGIIAATLGGLHPLGVALAAMFIALISNGSQTVSFALGVPVYLGDIVQSTLLLVTLGMLLLQNYRIERR